MQQDLNSNSTWTEGGGSQMQKLTESSSTLSRLHPIYSLHSAIAIAIATIYSLCMSSNYVFQYNVDGVQVERSITVSHTISSNRVLIPCHSLLYAIHSVHKSIFTLFKKQQIEEK